MDRTLKDRIAEEAAKLIPKGTRKEFAASIGVDPSQLSRFLKNATGLGESRVRQLAKKLKILSQLESEAQDSGACIVGYCPSADCMGASLFIEEDGLYIKPFFHSPAPKYCPFCIEEPLRTHCARKAEDGRRCAADIREGARSCTHCGKPYVETPEEYLRSDPVHQEEFVRETMLLRRQVVHEYVSRYGTRNPHKQLSPRHA